MPITKLYRPLPRPRHLRRLAVTLAVSALPFTAACGEEGALLDVCGDACLVDEEREPEDDTTGSADDPRPADEGTGAEEVVPSADAISVDALTGPVAKAVQSPPAETAPQSLDQQLADVRAFCASATEQAPPALPLPEVDTLPAYCDEQARYEQLVDACGALEVVVVAEGALGGDGSAAAPFGTLAQAFGACSGGCHVLVGPGEYAASGLDVPSCTFIEGAVVVDAAAGLAKVTSTLPRIDGALSVGSNTVLARVIVDDSYGALYAEDGALISESTLIGGYEGVGAAWSATGFDVCRSTIRAGYSGAGLSWESHGLRIAGSAISACYEGIGLSWGSYDLDVVGNHIYGAYEAVGTSWGSHTVTVTGNHLVGDYAAVSIHLEGNGPDEPTPSDFAVLVTDNTVDGSLPAHDEGLGISVTNNVSMD
jgi:hypothetical protein